MRFERESSAVVKQFVAFPPLVTATSRAEVSVRYSCPFNKEDCSEERAPVQRPRPRTSAPTPSLEVSWTPGRGGPSLPSSLQQPPNENGSKRKREITENLQDVHSGPQHIRIRPARGTLPGL